MCGQGACVYGGLGVSKSYYKRYICEEVMNMGEQIRDFNSLYGSMCVYILSFFFCDV